jgi:hypothetical protein
MPSLLCKADREGRGKDEGGLPSFHPSGSRLLPLTPTNPAPAPSSEQVDPAAVVAPRAKAVVVREHIKRKGRNLLGRSPRTGQPMSDNLRRSPTESSNVQRQRRADLHAERERQREAAAGGEQGGAGDKDKLRRHAHLDLQYERVEARAAADQARREADQWPR